MQLSKQFIQKLTLILVILILVIVIGIYGFILSFAIDNPTRLVDDAFIYLRYVKNISNGFGLSWNPGETPVEGFTSLVYLLLLAIADKSSIEPMKLMPYIGIGSCLLTLLLCWFLGKYINPAHDVENLLAIILVGLSPTFLFWSAAGLDIPLYTSLLMASVLSYLAFKRRKIPAWLVGVIFAITTLTRPEGLIIFGVTILYEVLSRVFGRKIIIDQDTLAIIIGFLLVFTPVYFWKWTYFGKIFPNTYYAKTGGGSAQIIGGITYLATSIFHVFAGIGIPLFLIFFRFKQIKATKIFKHGRGFLACILACSWGMVVINGGDHFILGRFLMPTIPLLLLIIITIAFSGLFENQENVEYIKPFFILLPILIAIIFWSPWFYLSIQDLDTTGFIKIGQTLNEVASSDESIAVIPIGAIGYYSEMNVIDMLGLVDQVIAREPFDPRYTSSWRPGHDKGNGLYILSKQPDYILLVDKLTPDPQPIPDDYANQFKSVVEIWDSPEFLILYEFYPIQTHDESYINLYKRVGNLENQESP